MNDDDAIKYYREKAEQCRLMAKQIINQSDPVKRGLLNMAVEFEALSEEANKPKDFHW